MSEKFGLPPKGIGFSKRLRITLIIVFTSVIALFLYFVNRYTPKAITLHQGEMIKQQGSNDNSIQMIKKIQSQANGPAVVSGVSPPAKTKEMTLVEALTPSLDDLKAAADSPIVVYHHEPISLSRAARSDRVGNKDYGFTQHLKKPTAQLKAGTIIPAILVTGINSELPGTIVAKVSHNVFDSVTGNDCEIPQGTTVIGKYSSQIVRGQSRVLVAWSRLIFPDGRELALDNMPGVDQSGQAGLSDQVDNHYLRIFGSSLAFSLLGAAGQLSQPQSNNNQLSNQQLLYGAVGQQMSQTASQLVQKDMNIAPTINIRAGTEFNILLSHDLTIPNA